jgi:hypothetical protein
MHSNISRRILQRTLSISPFPLLLIPSTLLPLVLNKTVLRTKPSIMPTELVHSGVPSSETMCVSRLNGIPSFRHLLLRSYTLIQSGASGTTLLVTESKVIGDSIAERMEFVAVDPEDES